MTPDLIADALARAIREQEFPGGAQLVQEDLAKRFGVSRNPVREALRLLEANGLVEIRPGGGATVRTLSDADVVELYDLRKLLEPTIATSVVLEANGRTTQDLADLADRMANTEDTTEWLSLNFSFHDTLYATARRPRTVAILRMLLSAVQPYSRRNVGELGGREQADRDHADMVDALRNRDAARLAAVLVVHLEGAEGRLLDAETEPRGHVLP